MPRTAIYICDCMGLVSDHVDTPALARLARGLGQVDLVRRRGKLCGAADLQRLIRELKRDKIRRLLFAGCSPRMSLKLPEERLLAAAAAGGVDPSRVEVANIREQGAWLHRESRADATDAARAHLRMAHSRLVPGRPSAPQVPLERRALVVGGGSAGLAAARHLAASGCPVTLLEERDYLGGTLCQLPFMFQTEGWPSTCESQCVGPVQASPVVFDPLVTHHTSCRLEGITKEAGNFLASFTVAPRFVDPDRCLACGRCEAVCPEDVSSTFECGQKRRKAISKPFVRSMPEASTLDPTACTRCGDCLEVCPTGAIDLEARPRTIQERAGAVILATGSRPTERASLPELKVDSPNVVTALEFERMMASGVVRPDSGEEPEHIVFVQCAGSRAGMDKRGSGVPYCSKNCCSVTAKQAKRLSIAYPMIEVSVIYYRDFRTYERALEKLHQDLRAMGITFQNGEVTGIQRLEEGELSVAVAGITEEMEMAPTTSIECDLVVLACAQEPTIPEAVRGLGFPRDAFGFPIETQPRVFRPTETFVDRVYAVGAALGPKTIQHSAEQGTAAAQLTLEALSKKKKRPVKHVSSIDQEFCSKCDTCISVCPHGAIRMDAAGASVDPGFCQGCGMCAATCPAHAASLRNFSDQALLDEVRAAFVEHPRGEPRILSLLCYWCAYGGVDLAGIHGLSAPAGSRTLRIRCSCSVNMGAVMEMFKMGVDGIVIAGCPPHSCHHMWGNWLADKRTGLMKKLMQQIGLNDKRLRYETIGIMHDKKFIELLTRMRQDLKSLGPNPLAAGEATPTSMEVSWPAK